MTPRLPDDPAEIRRVADELLRTAIPDDIPRTESIVDIVELIARGTLEQALKAADDPDTLRPCVRFGVVRMMTLGDDPSDDARQVGGIQYTELATCETDPVEVLRRITPLDRGEYIAATRIVGNGGKPWATVVILGGLCPDEAQDMAGEPFVIATHAHKNDDGDIVTAGNNGEAVLDDERAPDELRAVVRALFDMARRSA